MVVPADARPSPLPSYEELAGLFGALGGRVDALETENAALRAENAELRRRLGMNSRNSSTPPSKEPIAAKADRKAKRRRIVPRVSGPRIASREASRGIRVPGLTPRRTRKLH